MQRDLSFCGTSERVFENRRGFHAEPKIASAFNGRSEPQGSTVAEGFAARRDNPSASRRRNGTEAARFQRAGYVAHTWSQWRRFAAAVLLPGSRRASSGSSAAAAGGHTVLLARGGHATPRSGFAARTSADREREKRSPGDDGHPRPRARQHWPATTARERREDRDRITEPLSSGFLRPCCSLLSARASLPLRRFSPLFLSPFSPPFRSSGPLTGSKSEPRSGPLSRVPEETSKSRKRNAEVWKEGPCILYFQGVLRSP